MKLDLKWAPATWDKQVQPSESHTSVQNFSEKLAKVQCIIYRIAVLALVG